MSLGIMFFPPFFLKKKKKFILKKFVFLFKIKKQLTNIKNNMKKIK